MSEMVDRVAQRMVDEVLLKHQLLLDDQAKTLARAAIAAMREPTAEMCQAAMMAAVTEENKGVEYAPKQGWQSMIDEALK